MAEGFRHFDYAVDEAEGKTAKFTLTTKHGSEDFEIDLNVDAFQLMDWLRSASKPEGVPLFMDIFLDEDDQERMRGLKARWNELQPVMVWLAQELGGPGGSGN